MNKVLVVVFDSEDKARTALAALEALAEADSIRLNASALVTKNAGGGITVSAAEDRVPEGTLGATAVGVLIGILAGGIGVAVGAATGLIVGSVADMFYLHIGRGFLADVKRTLAPGKTALVAQMYEEDTGAVDKRIGELGGVAFRQPVGDVADDRYATAVSSIRRRIGSAG
jgi:uncharacterized membrane protein